MYVRWVCVNICPLCKLTPLCAERARTLVSALSSLCGVCHLNHLHARVSCELRGICIRSHTYMFVQVTLHGACLPICAFVTARARAQNPPSLANKNRQHFSPAPSLYYPRTKIRTESRQNKPHWMWKRVQNIRLNKLRGMNILTLTKEFASIESLV